MKKPITPKGYATLKDELQRLRAQRPEAAKAIEIARGHGDLSENADYDAAKNRSGLLEAKIRDLESKLALSEPIDASRITVTGKVMFGTVVRIADVDSGEEKTLSIVGEYESDIESGMLSLAAPLGRALIGKAEGDVVRVNAPGGTKEYEILSIEPLMQEDQ